MRTQIMKWIAVTALLAAALLWSSAATWQFSRFLLGCVVCLGAGVVVVQAAQAKKFVWTIGFVGIALLFNPVAPVVPFGGELGRLLVLVSASAFAVSLTALKNRPVPSMLSITDRNPGSESL